MFNKIKRLFISLFSLISPISLISHSITMENTEKDDHLKIALCLEDPNSKKFTKIMETLIQAINIKRQKKTVQYVQNDQNLLHRNELLAIFKILKVNGHKLVENFDPGFLYKTIKNASEKYQDSAVFAYCRGNCHYLGIGTKKNVAKAKKLYEKSILGGFSCSFNKIAQIYEEGTNGEKNSLSEIVLFYHGAAFDLENSIAMNALARMYIKGIHVEKSPSTAIWLYKYAIKLGNANAMNNLAYIYFQGIHAEKNIPKAIRLYKAAATLSHKKAINNLAFLYFQGIYLNKNIAKAIGLYHKSVQLGYTYAMNNLAYLYENGMGMEKNTDKAIELYQKSISKGNMAAWRNLSALLLVKSQIWRWSNEDQKKDLWHWGNEGQKKH